jgi:hypothetical protein
VTGIRNKYLRRWCGTCWAQAVTSALTDRLKILRIRAGTNLADGNLSPQALLDCSIADDTKVSGFLLSARHTTAAILCPMNAGDKL